MLPDGSFLPFTRDGRARVLATSGEKRSPFHPDAGTFAEQGVKDIVVTEWFGIFAPPATPPATVNRAADAIARGLTDKALGEVYAQTGMVPESSTPAKLAALIKSDSETWTPRIKEMGFQPIE
jgi:tripartite-type tricarboxylate transporter receptor subunit TctC